MDQQQTIQQALNKISLADALMDQAKQINYSARKMLESLYSPASPERGKKRSLTKQQQAKIITRMERTMIRKAPAAKNL